MKPDAEGMSFERSRSFLSGAAPTFIHWIFPPSDADLPDQIREQLREHPVQYGVGGSRQEAIESKDRFNRCPNCEEWSPCSKRQKIEAHHINESEESR